jgi:hypothetical protein
MASAVVIAGACNPPPGLEVLPGAARLEQSRHSTSASPVFDGTKVELRGARGETLGLQVRVSDGRARTAELTLPDQIVEVTPFAVRGLEVREPSTDLYGPSMGKGTYPDVLIRANGAVRAEHLAYFDVAIREDAAPGTYKGQLNVDGRLIPVTLRVSLAEMNLDNNPLVWVFYLPREIARVHGLSDDDGPEELEKERQYANLFRAHGALLASDLPPSRFEARRKFVRDVRYWPVAVDTSSDEAIERDTRAWLALFAGSDVTPFTIPVDEPHDEASRARARHIAEVIGRAGGGRPRLLRAVTDTAWNGYGDVMDVFISPKAIPGERAARRGRGEQFWTYNGKPPEAGSMTLDTETGGLRTWGWIAERYGIPLWYAWEGLYFSDRYNGGGPTDVMRESVTFDERRHGGTDFGNGDGVLAYPGPLPSLRLKALRRGLEDRLLLEQLKSCGGGDAAARIVQGVVPKALAEAGAEASWPSTESGWGLAHDAILDAIEARCHAN